MVAVNDNGNDWLTVNRDQFIEDTAALCGTSEETVRQVYQRCAAAGLIDYDVEKDVLYDLFEGTDQIIGG